MSVVEGLKIQVHVCGTYVLSVWFTLFIGFGSVYIFSWLFKTCRVIRIIGLRFSIPLLIILEVNILIIEPLEVCLELPSKILCIVFLCLS